jgi:uncharacterized repeat protein (TIGR01451 family)
MKQYDHILLRKIIRISLPLLSGVLLLVLVLGAIYLAPSYADPIEPPAGFPKFSTSVKTVTPTLAYVGGETLLYTIEIRNTGAYAADDVTMTDRIPDGTSYNGDAAASDGQTPDFSNGTLIWNGDVGFDSVVLITFSVDVAPTFTGMVVNTAVINQEQIASPVTVNAKTRVSDTPIFSLDKTSETSHPGPEKPLIYTLTAANWGQPTVNLPMVGLVPSGTIITNENYSVDSSLTSVTSGIPYSVTVVDPIFSLSKSIWPDPPGSNREMTYTLTLLNEGSLATDIVINDVVPSGVAYVRGGTESDGIVSWNLPSLAAGEFAEFTFTVYIGDVAYVPIVNDDYAVCSSEDVCQAGETFTTVVQPANFVAYAYLYPIAKKPGGGGGPVTPTLIVENLGPGNAYDAKALLTFERISVSGSDFMVIPPVGIVTPNIDCGSKCDQFFWLGDLAFGDVITFTTIEGQSTIGGEEGTLYTATISITDTLGITTTEPVTATAVGHVTHYANLLPVKTAPPVIGSGQLMTYSINVWNSGLSTDEPPLPMLTDTVPASTTLVRVSHGGESQTINSSTVVSWTLPPMSPGDRLARSYTVRVDDDLISGTQIVNDDYRTSWYELELGTILSNTGPAFTTTVHEVGLIDSFKVVTPMLALPGPNIVLTFSVHIVNSGPDSLSGVSVYDWLPWEHSTYQRDAVATSGQIISDIVSVEWYGDVAPFSEEVITMTVLVDPFFKGAITNTAVINHPELLQEITVEAVAYITDEPVLHITKSASPDPVQADGVLKYTVRVANLGQLATSLIITDAIPSGVSYVPDSATGGGILEDGILVWNTPLLQPGEDSYYTFQVEVGRGSEVINDRYGVISAEGVSATGDPVVTVIIGGIQNIYLPALHKS